MKRKAIFMLIFFSLMSTLLSPTIPMSATSTDAPKVAMSAEIPERSVTYEFYDFFDVEEEMAPLASVWEARKNWPYMDEIYHVQSWTYPVVYSIENTKADSHTYYSGCRLKINATGIQDINMTTPVKVGPPPYDPTKPPVYEIGQFLPYNLTGGLEPGVTDGTADISLWCGYINIARAAYWDEWISYDFVSWHDGWQTELNGTITLDKNATMEVLGITSAQYDDIENWWATNGATVETEWEAWATYLGEWWPMIVPMYSNWLFTDIFWVRADFSQLPEKLVLNWWIAGWAEEAFMSRFLSWGPTAIMPGFEGWYHDFHLTASIGPEYSNILVDTIVDYALICVSLEPYGDSAWVFETVQGDKPAIAHAENFVHGRAMNHTWSDAYAYYKYPNGTYKKYYTLSAGSINYDDYTPYAGVTGVAGYTPEAWDLREGETLIFNFSNTINNPVWGWKQGTWGAGQIPNDELTKVYGVPYLGYMEPYPADLGTQYDYDSINGILTITGPFNMTDWSNTTYPSYWARLADPDLAPNGLLPGGCPFIYFNLGAPVATFTYTSLAPKVNDTVTFDASLSYAFNGKNIASYKWDFGDGNVTTTTNPIIYHKYTTAETYTVTLTVTDDEGLNATATDTVKVFAEMIRDVAVTSVTPSPTEVTTGETVSINVTVKNNGTEIETFNVTAYYDNTEIDTETVTNLAALTETTLTFTWDTTGVPADTYTISANASQVTGETNLTNNVYVDGDVTVTAIHDVAVTSVTPSPTEVTTGDSVTVTVIVENEGTESETFDVTVYYDTTEIDTETVTNLASGATETLTFTWDTTDVDEGDYTVKAVASPVAGETDTADNVKTATVTVTAPEPEPSAISTELIIGIVIIVIIVVAAAAFLYMKRKTPRT